MPKHGRKKGRPKKGDAPRINYDELDRMLVFGEIAPNEDGSGTRVVYPAYREVAERFGVSAAFVAEYARTHNCMGRRDETEHIIQKKADQILIERRASAIALSREDELQIIDTYLVKFREALEDGRVRFDNPADFDRMIRLKEFLLGGADSRAEVQATISLGDIQARYLHMQRVVNTTAEERGEPITAALAAPATEVASPLEVGDAVAEPLADEHNMVAASGDLAATDPAPDPDATAQALSGIKPPREARPALPPACPGRRGRGACCPLR